MKKTYILLTLLFTISGLCSAQVRQTAHIEFEIDKKMGTNYFVVEADTAGVLLVHESERLEEGNRRQLIFTFLNNQLMEQWKSVYLTDNGSKLIHQQYSEGFMYLLIQEKDSRYTVLKFNVSDGLASQISIAEIERFTITHFDARNGYILLGGEENGNPLVVLMRYNQEKKPIVLPSVNQLKADLVDVIFDSKSERLLVIMKQKNSLTRSSFYANWYDLSGNVLLNREITLSEEYNLLTYRPYLKADGSILMLGTYGLKNDRLAQGVYSLKLVKGKLEQNRFYDFAYLKNFFNYLPAKKREKYLEKVQKRLEEGKKKRFAYKLFVHDLEVQEDKILFVAESYDTETTNNGNQPLDRFYGANPYPSMRGFFSRGMYSPYLPSTFARDPWLDKGAFPTEFDYVHTLALGFDKEGKLLWDNSYTFEDTESIYPMELSKVSVSNDSMAFFQYKKDHYLFKTGVGSDYETDHVEVEVPKQFAGDESQKFDHGGLLKWYGNHFLVSGIRKIKNKVDKEKNREVLFISRYTFNPEWDDVPKEETSDRDLTD